MSAEVVEDQETEAFDAAVLPPPDVFEEAVAPAPAPPRPQNGNGKKRPAPAPSSNGGGQVATGSPLATARVAQEEVLRDWIMGLGGGGDVEVHLSRMEPETYKGVKTNGLLKKYSEPIDVDTIQKHHGGGLYQIKIRTRGPTGKLQWNGSKNVHVAGVPRLDSLQQRDEEALAVQAQATGVIPGGMAPAPGQDLAGKAFDFATRMAESRMSQPAPAAPPGLDAEMIASIARPYEAAMARMEAQMDRMTTARDKPSIEDKLQDSILNKLIDNDSARMNALRIEHDSEIRQLKENAREDQKRAQDAWDRERDRMTADHARQLDRDKQQAELVLMSVRQNLEGTNAFQQRELTRLEREIADLKREVLELRAKKDKTPFELAKEVEALRGIFGSDDDGKEKTSGVERVIGKAIDSPLVQGIAERILNNIAPADQAAQQQAQQMPPVGKPFRGTDGGVYVNNGQAIVPYRPNRKKKVQQAAAQAAAAEAAAAGATPEEQQAAATAAVAASEAAEADAPNIDPETIVTVISFMEGAFGRNTEPEVMAQTIKTQVPGAVLAYIGSHGVDAFLDQVASLPKTSPLAQQAGRNWVRKLAKALLAE